MNIIGLSDSSRSTATAAGPGRPLSARVPGPAPGAAVPAESAGPTLCDAAPAESVSTTPTPGQRYAGPAEGSFDLGKVLEETARQAASLATKLGDHVEGQALLYLRPGTDLETFGNNYGVRIARKFRIPDSMRDRLPGELVLAELGRSLSTAQMLAAVARDGRVGFAAANDYVQATADEPAPGTKEPPVGAGKDAKPVGAEFAREGNSAGVDLARPGSTPSDCGSGSPARPEPRLPNDLHQQQWALNNTGQTGGVAGKDIQAPLAWGLSTGSRTDGPIIALVDSGIDYNHPDLNRNMWRNPAEIPDNGVDDDGNGLVDDVYGGNFHPNNGNPMDDNRHGTHVAGIIGADTDNGQGVAGVMWESRLMAVKFLEKSGRGKISDAIEGILYANSKGARVTTQAWGSTVHNQVLYEVLAASPAFHVFAAGNDRQDNDRFPIYPGNFDLPNAVTVASSTQDGTLSPFTNRGHNSVHMAAPGLEIYNTVLDGGYASLGGTAAAVGHTAGVAGLILSRYPNVTNDQIKARLLNSVDLLPPGERDRVATGGTLNAFKALEDDQTPPGRPAGLRLEDVTDFGFELAWTALGGDMCQGQARRYELAYSELPIADGQPQAGEISFEQASHMGIQLPAPGPTGTPEHASVQVPPSGRTRTLNVALRAVDQVGNRSELARTAVSLPGSPVAFEDNFDSGPNGWSPENTWGQVDLPGRGKVWTDSPGGEYQDSRDDSLTSPVISLKGWRNCKLHFEARYGIELNHDSCKLEIRSAGGDWSELDSYDGNRDWTAFEYDLSPYAGQDVQLRFHLKTDDSRTSDGIYVDNLVIAGRRQTQDG